MAAIASRLDDAPLVGFDRSSQDRIVAGEGGFHRLGIKLPQVRATLEIDEQNSIGSRGECSSQLCSLPRNFRYIYPKYLILLHLFFFDRDAADAIRRKFIQSIGWAGLEIEMSKASFE